MFEADRPAWLCVSGTSRQGKKAAALHQSQFYSRPSGGVAGADVRAKAVEQMVAALDKVAAEGGVGVGGATSASVAAAVEQELFALSGTPPPQTHTDAPSLSHL